MAAHLAVRASNESTAPDLIKRLRRFQRAYGEGHIAPRPTEQLLEAAAEGLILYCDDRRGWMHACVVLFQHAAAKKSRGGASTFFEAGGVVVRKGARGAGVVSLLLTLGTLAAVSKHGGAEAATCFALTHIDRESLGLYRRMPNKAAAAAMAAVDYGRFPIHLGRRHFYYEFQAVEAAIAQLRSAAAGLIGEQAAALDLRPVEHLFLRWGLPAGLTRQSAAPPSRPA